MTEQTKSCDCTKCADVILQERRVNKLVLNIMFCKGSANARVVIMTGSKFNVCHKSISTMEHAFASTMNVVTRTLNINQLMAYNMKIREKLRGRWCF